MAQALKSAEPLSVSPAPAGAVDRVAHERAGRMSTPQLVARGRTVIEIARDALADLAAGLDTRFAHAVRAVLACQGRVAVCGIGKSGMIARKLAATLAATATPAFFLHAAEAAHGDLGQLVAGDVLIMLSRSGRTAELSPVVAHARRLGLVVIAIGADPASPLMADADVALTLARAPEACPAHFAPTTSTTQMLVLGDALAMAVMAARGVVRSDLAALHPGGWTPGLAVRPAAAPVGPCVADVMRPVTALPMVDAATPMRTAVAALHAGGLGLVGVTEPDGAVLGVITDADLRAQVDHVLHARAGDLVAGRPLAAPPEMPVTEALALLCDHCAAVLWVAASHAPWSVLGVVLRADLAAGTDDAAMTATHRRDVVAVAA